MKGNPREGKKIIKKIRKSLKSDIPKVIFTMGAPATKLAREGITDVPIAYCMVVNPEKKGFVGDNISGISQDVPISIQLNQLKRLIPTVKNVGIIYDPENSDNIIEEANQATSELALNLIAYKISSSKEVPRAVRNIISEIDALLVITDSTVINKDSFKFIITTTLENKIPTVIYNEYLVKAGFLFSMTPDHASIGKQAGKMICIPSIGDEVEKPVVAAPEVQELSINLKTAKRIGLDISSEVIDSVANVYN